MDYEKKYKEALEIAKAWHKLDSNDLCNADLETLFPELKESEDERTRKALLYVISRCEEEVFSRVCASSQKECIAWLEKQGEPTEVNPTEFDLRLNRLLKQFESLPKEELITNLSYYLNVIQNDGTYKIEKQGEKSQRMISAETKEVLYNKPTWSEEDEIHINSIIDYLLDYKLLVYEEDMNVANGVQKEIDWLKNIKQRIG